MLYLKRNRLTFGILMLFWAASLFVVVLSIIGRLVTLGLPFFPAPNEYTATLMALVLPFGVRPVVLALFLGMNLLTYKETRPHFYFSAMVVFTYALFCALMFLAAFLQGPLLGFFFNRFVFFADCALSVMFIAVTTANFIKRTRRP